VGTTDDEARTAMRLGGRIAGRKRALRVASDPQREMAAVWAGRQARYERQVDPDGVLPPHERAKLAKAAERVAMAELSLRRHQAAKRRRQAAATVDALTRRVGELDAADAPERMADGPGPRGA